MSNSLGKNSLITLIGQLFKTLFQGLSFILVARALGASDFGIFISILALCSMLSPFVDFGAYHLVVKRISHGEPVAKVAGDSIGVLVTAAPFFILIFCLLTIGIYDYPIILAILVGFSMLFFDKLLSIFIAINISRDSFKIVAIIEGFSSFIRFIFALIVYQVQGDVTLWVSLLFLNGLITGIVIYFLINREFKFFPLYKPTFKFMYSGMPFVWNLVGANVNQDFDKICLSKMSGTDVAGIYAAVMRVLNLALIPIYAFYMTAYSRFFKAAHEGQEAFTHALKMLVPSALIGLVTSLCVFLVAPYVPLLLGDEYQAAVELIKIAVIVPILQTLANPFADTLSGYGKQTLRVYILFASLFVNVVLNLMLIPEYGAKGALMATIISHFFYLIACVWTTYRSTRTMIKI